MGQIQKYRSKANLGVTPATSEMSPFNALENTGVGGAFPTSFVGHNGSYKMTILKCHTKEEDF